MEKTELTFGRSTKIWWSFMWRNMVFAIPVTVFIVILTAVFMPKQIAPGQKPEFPFVILLLWPVMMVSMCAVQILALKYALGAKWAGFRIVAVKAEEETNTP